MLVILALYAVLVWLLFWKLKLLKWGWASGVLTVFCGAFIFAVLLVMFNYLTPSGTFVVTSRTVDIAPNISGRVIATPVKPDQPVKAGATLLQIDPAPFRSKVDQLQASLAQARQQADQLRAGYVQTTAVVDGLTRQLERQRLDERPPAGSRDARDQFRLQDTRSDMLQSQLQVARAAQSSAKQALDAEIDRIASNIAGIQTQLEHATQDLEHTTIRAPGNGSVPAMALTVGDRVLQGRPVMSFVVVDDIIILGVLSASESQTILPGALVKLVFDDHPGHIHHATVVEITEGAGAGKAASSSVLTKLPAGGGKVYSAVISLPADIDRERLRPGMPGSAWVLADGAGLSGLITSILVWVSSYMAYL